MKDLNNGASRALKAVSYFNSVPFEKLHLLLHVPSKHHTLPLKGVQRTLS